MNLVIGDTSQLSHFFPKSFERLSSRNINLKEIPKIYENIYITFAQQNVFESDGSNFTNVNTFLPLEVSEYFLESCKKIVVYTTCEMYNNHVGSISLETLPSFKPKNNNNYTNYILSKLLLFKHIEKNRKKNSLWEKVVIIHPFNFESSFKNKQFLFGKIKDSILNKKKIEVGNLDFYKDLSHTKRIVQASMDTHVDLVFGSGKLYNVRETIKKIYDKMDLDFNEYVKEESHFSKSKPNFYYSSNQHTYDFVEDFVEDLKSVKL